MRSISVRISCSDCDACIILVAGARNELKKPLNADIIPTVHSPRMHRYTLPMSTSALVSDDTAVGSRPSPALIRAYLTSPVLTLA